MGEIRGGQGDIPLLFEVEGTLCFVPLLFRGQYEQSYRSQTFFVLMHNCTALITFTYIAVLSTYLLLDPVYILQPLFSHESAM